MEDEFERVANDDNTTGHANPSNPPGGAAKQQKEFIIKKMFKVPSNEQVAAYSNQSSVNQSGALSAKGTGGINAAGINIYNVNNPVEGARTTQNVVNSEANAFHNTFYNPQQAQKL